MTIPTTKTATRKPSAATRKANATAAPPVEPSAAERAGTDKDQLKGVTAPEPAPKPRVRTAPVTTGGLAALSAAATKIASDGKVRAAKIEKAPKPPRIDVGASKNALAALIVKAAGDAIAKAKAGTFPGIEDPARQAAQWLHYLPVGNEWPAGLPVPGRSEWNDDGTRV